MSEEIICAITPPNSPVRSLTVDDKQESDTESTGIHCKSIVTFRWFSCIGEAKLEKIELSEDSYLKNNEFEFFEDCECLPYTTFEPKNINLFDESFDFGSAILDDCASLFKMARSEIIRLQDAVKLNHTHILTYSDLQPNQVHRKARTDCVQMFLYIREYLNCAIQPKYNWILGNFIPRLEENISWFRLFLSRLTNLPEYVLHHAAHTNGNKCLDASYHLFHGTLDVMWLHLATLYQVGRCRRQMEASAPASQLLEHTTSGTGVSLEQSLVALIADLVQLAIVRFEKIDIRGLLIKSPFNCNCVAELWILLQVFSNRLHSKGIIDSFWSFVNKVLGEVMTGGNCQRRTNCMSLTLSVTRPCSNTHAFTLWLVKHLAMLQTFDAKSNCSNYQLLELIVKGLLSSDVPEAHMRIYLTFIEKILINYWEPKSDTIILLWEHFQKRLNSTFFVPGSSIESMAIMSESVTGMVKQVKSRLVNRSHCEDSYQLFLRIIGLFLQRVSHQNGQHWKQIRGRIYSKLSASKMQSLTEVGIYHLSSLFLTLAVTAELNEVCKKLQGLLRSLPEADMETSMKRLVWRTQLSICLLYAERGMDFTPYVSQLTSVLDNTTTHQDISLFRTYVEGVKDILESCPGSKIEHNILIGSWVVQYLADCSSNDAARLLELIQIMILRSQKEPFEQAAFQKKLWQLLAPYLRLKVCEDSPLQLADLSLNLCLLSRQGCDTLKEILHLFINNNAANIGLIRRFLYRLVQQRALISLLSTSSPGTNDSCEVLIVKRWIHCSLVSLDYKSSELCKVTEYIAYLPFISDICMDLPSATDPLVHFIVAISNKFKTAKDISERSSLRNRMTCYFSGMEKWVEPYIKETKSPEMIGRIYHVVGLIFSLMPSLIYVKSRPNTVLNGLLDVMFFPMKAYKPDFEPSPHIKAAIAADIHLYVKGLAGLGMMQQDSYIERCVEDLVKIYLPWVIAGSRCGLQECVEREGGAARLVLTATCTSFLKRKASSPHPHCAQALKFLKSIVTTYSRNFKVIHELVDCCFDQLCDVIMFCDEIYPSKNIARDVMVSIFECHSFNDELCEVMMAKFEKLCREHLPFMPGKLFGLFHEVLRHRPELVSRFLPTLQNHIKIVETKRGITFDQSLRAYSETLEKALERLRKGA